MEEQVASFNGIDRLKIDMSFANTEIELNLKSIFTYVTVYQ